MCGIIKNGDALRVFKESSDGNLCMGDWDDYRGDELAWLLCDLTSNAWAYDAADVLPGTTTDADAMKIYDGL